MALLQASLAEPANRLDDCALFDGSSGLEQQLELERMRAIMGRFLVFMAVTYIFVLKLAVEVLPANVSPSAITIPIVVSNALFASAHLHLSVSFAFVAFLLGLLWGALFARQRNIVGVSVSHTLCGWFGFLVLGFEPWY